MRQNLPLTVYALHTGQLYGSNFSRKLRKDALIYSRKKKFALN
jgi:hypothetical protein